MPEISHETGHNLPRSEMILAYIRPNIDKNKTKYIQL